MPNCIQNKIKLQIGYAGPSPTDIYHAKIVYVYLRLS